MAGLSLRNAGISLVDGERTFKVEIDVLDVPEGQAVALTGVSGSGKTLVLELLGLLRAPDAGASYFWKGQNLASLWSKGPRNRALAQCRGEVFGFVPQTGGLLPFLTVSQNIGLSQSLTGRMDSDWQAALIERLGLGDVSGLFPAALSIGQRQRTSIARALAHRPAFVIADEPTAALDPSSADQVLELFLEIAQAQGSGVILSSHDQDRIARHGIGQLKLAMVPGGRPLSRLVVV